MPTTAQGFQVIPTEHEISTGDFLDTPVRDLMSPAVVTIAEDASLKQVYRALAGSRIHAVPVVGKGRGKPLGWVTARGLLAWIDRDSSLAVARDAITEQPLTIEPSATAREAVAAISRAGTTHLLVSRAPDRFPEGVVSDLDLAALAGR